jgi:hypothetical protein
VVVDVSSELLGHAIVLWTGMGATSWPKPDPQRVVALYGPVAAARLMSLVDRLYDDFYASDARRFAPDLAAMGDQAAAEFRVKHPEIADDAVEALARCYTWDYKSARARVTCTRGRLDRRSPRHI